MSTPTRHHLHEACDLAFVRGAPACFGVVHDGPGLRLVDGPYVDRVDDLIGFTAPPWWSGVAFVGDGRGVRLDDRSAFQLRMSFALARTGEHATFVTSEVGTDRSDGPGLAADRPSGHLADLCHRALGLPTAAEPTTPDVVDDAIWLDEVLRAHDQLGPAFDPHDAGPLLSLHPRLGAPTTRTWHDVHAALVALGCGWGPFTVDELAWMDGPTWARYVLDEVPPLDTLLAAVGQVLSTAAMAVVHASVGRDADSVRADDRGGGG